MTQIRRLFALVGRFFRPLALVGTVLGVGIALWGQRGALEHFDWNVSPFAAGGAVGLFALAPVVQGLCFHACLRALEVPARLDEALVIWMRSFLVRYAPSGALAFVLRTRARGRLGATSEEIWVASAYEQLVALLSGACAAVCFSLAGEGHKPPLVALALALAAIAVAFALRPSVAGPVVVRALARRGIAVPRLLRGRAFAAIALANSLGWVASGAGAWVGVHALAPGVSLDVLWLTGAYAFAWLLGFVVPLLPGGLGLREAVLAGLLAGHLHLGLGVAAAIVLALRLANTLGELVAIGGTEAAYRIWVRLRPRASSAFADLQARHDLRALRVLRLDRVRSHIPDA